MPRRRRPFIRESANRDAKLIIIATEDTKATVRYFRGLSSSDYYQNPGIHVEIIHREETASSPEHVLDQLDEWIAEYQINEDDELWLVIDVDRWGEKKLNSVTRKCIQKNIYSAISNPAIELWFLLHIKDLADLSSQERQDLLENEKVNSRRTYIEQVIIDILDRYNKSNLQVDDFIPHVEQAIEQAEALDDSPNDRWPQTLGTHVYRLARSIIDDAPYK